MNLQQVLVAFDGAVRLRCQHAVLQELAPDEKTLEVFPLATTLRPFYCLV